MEERRGFECHENSGFPLSVSFLFASCLARHELGELCFAFFPNFFFLPHPVFCRPDFLSARIVSPAWRDENDELIVVPPCYKVFSNFLPRLSSSVACFCFIVFFQRAASQRLAYPLPSSLAALRHHVSARQSWTNCDKYVFSSGSLFSCPEQLPEAN